MEAAEKEKKIVTLTEVKPTQDGYRWVAITAMLLAIGIILHTVSPNVGGVTPNWTIAMYSIVINLTNPSLPQALGIGFISGMTLVPSSKSAFPLGNLASEVCGAVVCCLLVKAMLAFIFKIVLGLPFSVWLYAMLPVVAVIGVLNGSITFLLYGPVRRLFFVQEEDN